MISHWWPDLTIIINIHYYLACLIAIMTLGLMKWLYLSLEVEWNGYFRVRQYHSSRKGELSKAIKSIASHYEDTNNPFSSIQSIFKVRVLLRRRFHSFLHKTKLHSTLWVSEKLKHSNPIHFICKTCYAMLLSLAFGENFSWVVKRLVIERAAESRVDERMNGREQIIIYKKNVFIFYDYFIENA